jgi:basic membrane protein A
MDAKRRYFLRTAGGLGIAGLAGCLGGGGGDGDGDGDGNGDGDGDASPTDSPSPTPGPEAWVGMVYATGGLGDGSFNDQAQQGALQAEEELGIAFDEAQPEEVADFATFQQQFAESDDPDYDLISCIGFLQTDALTETSQDYPDQNFMLVDSVVEQPNVGNYVFAEEQGSYLVGQLAGLLTTADFSAGGGSTLPDQTTVGFVGGVEVPLIEKFQAGFEAGVKAANDSVEILSNYTGSFNDPSAGREAALAMYDNNADIIYHASGNTGTGVFQAAQEEGRYAIGVDRDQSVTKDSYADVILASMVKRVDTAVYTAIESVVNDDFEGGSVVPLGLAEDGVGIVYGQSLGDAIGSGVKDDIESSRQGIIDGDIDVPTDPDNV